MSELLQADLQLRIDDFTAGLQRAAQQFAAFVQQASSSLGISTQAFQQQEQQINAIADATKRSAQSVGAIARERAAEQKRIDDELHQQYVARASFEKKAAQEARAIEKQAADDLTAQYRATADFLRKQEQQRQTDHQATVRAITALERQEATERRALARAEAAEHRRLAQERVAVAREAAAIEAREDLRFRARNAASNAQANMALSTLPQQELFLLQGYITLAKQAEKETTALDAAMLRIGSSFRTLGSYIVAGAIIGLPFQLMAWGKQAVQTAMEMESLNATFKAITGSTAAARRELDFVRTTADKLGLDFVQSAGNLKNLEAASRGTRLEGEKTRRLFEDISMAQRVMGTSTEQNRRGLVAIEQIISKNVLTQEELRGQLSESLPGAVNIMARALGVGTDELNKMIKSGGLLAEDVLPRFGRQLREELGAGLEAATQTASATFARFANNVRDISSSVGESILAILKPIMDAVNKAFEASRQAREEARAARENLVGPAPEDAGSIAEMGGRDLQGRIDRMREAIEERQEVLRKLKNTSNESGWGVLVDPKAIVAEEQAIEHLRKAYSLLLEQAKNFIKAQHETGTIGEGENGVPFAKQTKAIREEVEKLNAEMGRLDTQRKLFPSMITGDGKLDQAREKVRELAKAIEKVAEQIATSKGMGVSLPDDVAKKAAELDAKHAAAVKEVEGLEAAEELKKELEREDLARRNRLKAQARQDADERERLEEKMQVAIAAFEGEKAGKQRELLNQVLADAQRVETNRTLTARFAATERMRNAQIEAQKIMEEHDIAAAAQRELDEEQVDFQNEITRLQAKGTKSRLDDFNAAFEKIRQKWQDALDYERITEDQMTQLMAAGAAAAGEIVREENEKAAKDAAKSWRELGNTIESTLAGAFASILNGSKSLFEGIRSAFLSLLAKLAADALTHAIFIPAIVRFVGGGGSGFGSGGGFGGGSDSLFAGASLLGGAGGTETGGGNSMGSQALGLVSAGNSISGALGGPSIGIGSFGGFGAGLASMELGELGISGAGYIGGSTGSLGGLAAATVGQVVGGIGAGIAVGMILSKINSLIGINGTASAVLAGAGGGAAAGALLGTAVFPVIGTGIGAAIGTAVGALGGYLSTLFGKEGKQPGFKIEGMQAGQVAYDDILGLRVRQNFKILEDFHQKLGTDYEDFIKVMDDSINDLFQQVVDQLQGADPAIQKALIDPLNAAFADIAVLIRDYPKIGGEDFKQQLEVMLGTDLPKIFNDAANGAIGKFVEAVKKIDPVIKAFTQIIDSLLEDIKELQQQQKALDDTLAGNIKSLRESSMTPAELLLTRKQEYAALLAQFEGGDEATRILLAPQIGQLANAILDLSKSVFNPQQSFGDLTGIQGAIKQLQESLYTPAQTMAARQTDLANLLNEFRSGDIGVRTVLTPQITQLALQIMELAKGVNILAEQQALMQDFPAQLRAITEALFSPAQSYLSQRSQLTALMAQFRGSTPEQQLALEPQIANLASQILQLAKSQDVLGQDPQLLRQTQSELLSAVQEVQSTIAAQVNQGTSDAAMLQATLERTQAEMIGVLREVEYTTAGSIVQSGQQTIQALWSTAGQIIATDYAMSNGIITAQYYTTNGVVTAQYNSAGQLINTQHYIGGVLVGAANNTANTVAGWSNVLAQQQQALIGQVASVRDTAWYSYTQLQNALWTEIGLAQNEIQLLVNSLYHLETVDAVVQRALGVLGEMNARLGNPLNVRMDQGIGTQLQADTLQTTQQLLRSQQNANRAIIALLAKPAFGLDFAQGLDLGTGYTGYQHGGSIPFNMMAVLHRGERVIPEWENRGSGGGSRAISINVYGGTKDAGQIADEVIHRIEQKSGRLQSTTIQTSRR